MVEVWTRECPDCGNRNGTKVERIAFHSTFRCECGYIWDASNARFVGLWEVDRDATDETLDALADLVAARMSHATGVSASRSAALGDRCGFPS